MTKWLAGAVGTRADVETVHHRRRILQDRLWAQGLEDIEAVASGWKPSTQTSAGQRGAGSPRLDCYRVKIS